MGDMSQTIVAKSDQINAEDLLGGPITVTIREVRVASNDEQPCSIFLTGMDKVYRPSKGMRRILVEAWGDQSKEYIGRSMTLFREPSVTWAGKEEGGIRISHMSHIDGALQFPLRLSRASRKPYTVKPLSTALTIADAQAALNDATDLDALKTAWSAKAMAPFRDELAELLEQRKVALAPAIEGRTDAQHGDQNTDDDLPSITEWAARLDAATILGDVIAVEDEVNDVRDRMDDGDLRIIDSRIGAAKVRFTGGAK